MTYIAGLVHHSNRLVTSQVYILGIGPTSLIAKITGKSFYPNKPDPQVVTYWQDVRNPRPQFPCTSSD